MLKECKLLIFETLNVIMLYAFTLTLTLAPLRFESSAAHNTGSLKPQLRSRRQGASALLEYICSRSVVF